MAQRAGVSPATVQRIWSGRGLKPHRVQTFTTALVARSETATAACALPVCDSTRVRSAMCG